MLSRKWEQHVQRPCGESELEHQRALKEGQRDWSKESEWERDDKVRLKNLAGPEYQGPGLQ